MIGKTEGHETFNDGICRIYTTDEAGCPAQEVARFRMQERTVGVTRYYAAMQIQKRIERLLRIPQARWITEEHRAVIGNEVFEILQCQHISETKPPVTDLTLYRLGMMEGERNGGTIRGDSSASDEIRTGSGGRNEGNH